jgi:hypothetical protein
MFQEYRAHLNRTSIGFSAFLKAFRPWLGPFELFPGLEAAGAPGGIAIF